MPAVDVSTPDGVADAYLARPDSGGDLPAVLLAMDANGLRPRLEEMADRIASWGYVVLVPNLFYREGRAPVIERGEPRDADERARFLERVMPLIAGLTPERIVPDGAAYLGYLHSLTRSPVAITGYCMGARAGWRIAAAYPGRVAALAGFHGGGLVTEDDESPHLSASSLRSEVYFGHADDDPNMTREQIATLDAALDDAGVTYRSEVYEGALHGYTMSDGLVYDEAAAERHFTELSALLARTFSH